MPKPPQCNPSFPMTCNIPYSKNNFAPRVGFAYSLGEKNTTVVRGAFGLFYAMTDLLDVSQGLTSNGINRQFLFVAGPAFHNFNPIITYPPYRFPDGRRWFAFAGSVLSELPQSLCGTREPPSRETDWFTHGS